MAGSPQGVDLQELLVHADWVRQLARRLVAHASQADDVEQETWMAALRRPPAHGGNPRGWLSRTVANAARQLGRASERRRTHERAAACSEAEPSTADLAVRAALQRDVVDHVLALDEPFQSVVLLRFFQGLPPREIAERLRVPVKTVNSRLQRAFGKLRQRLEKAHGDRADWRHALVPLVGSGLGLPTAETLPLAHIGGWIVKTNAKIGIAAALTLAGALGLWRVLADRVSIRVPTQERVVASEPLPAAIDVDQTAKREPVPVRVGKNTSEPAQTTVVAYAPPAFRVHGRAVTLAGAPLGGVSIATTSAPSDSLAITAADGFFEVELEEPLGYGWQGSGSIALEVSDPRFVTLCLGCVTRTNRNREQLVVATTVVTLEGLVVDAADVPITGAGVKLGQQNRAFIGFPHALDMTSLATLQSTAGADGRFRFERFPGGSGLRLLATAAGFEAGWVELDDAPQPLVLRLVRRGEGGEPVVEGLVLSQRREPVEGATVQLGDEITKSGPRGTFELPLKWVEPTTPLCAAKAGSLPALIPDFGRLLDQRTGAERESIGPVELVLGGPPLEIRGRVVGPEGEPCAGWSVSISDETEISQMRIPIESAERLARSDRTAVETDRQGRFRLTGLYPRDYVVQAFDRKSLFRVESTVPAGATDALLRSANEVRHDVRGVVLSPHGEPLAEVRVSLSLDTLVTPYGSSFVGGGEIVTDASGTFAFDEVPRERVYLSFRGEGVLPTELRLPSKESDRAYEAIVFRRCHFRVESRDPAGPVRSVEFQDGLGQALQVNRFSANGMSGYPFVPLDGGRSEVLSVSEAAVIAVVKGAGDEAVLHRIALEPGVVNVLQF